MMSEVLAAANIKTVIIWVMTSCCQSFRMEAAISSETLCAKLHGITDDHIQDEFQHLTLWKRYISFAYLHNSEPQGNT
jgi:hypothetical protein